MSQRIFQVLRIPHKDLGKIWFTPVRFSSRFTEANFAEVWLEVRESLRSALARYWADQEPSSTSWRPSWQPQEKSHSDFIVSDERQEGWMHCGGVFTRRICCPRYVRTICEVLAETKHPNKWSYETVVELWHADKTLPIEYGQFVIKSDTLYIPKDDGIDYTTFYERKERA